MPRSAIRKRTQQGTKDARGFNTRPRYTCCPLCGANIPWHHINEHIDASHPVLETSPPSTTAIGQELRESQDAQAVPHSRLPSATPCTEPCPTLQPPWWRCLASAPALASGKRAGSKAQIPLTDNELRNLTPCEVVRNALPPKSADQLLRLLIQDSPSFKRGTWYIGGKKHDAPRTSSYYALQNSKELEGSVPTSKDVSADVRTQLASSEMQEAASIVNQHVNSLACRVQHDLTPEDRACWESSYVLCNMYMDGQEGVGPHADRLTMLGPRPVIASLSLGATRTFRMRCQAREPHQNSSSHGAQDASQQLHTTCTDVPPQRDPGMSATAALEQELVSADVQLPHNTLVVMWPPMQERWKHEILKTKNVAQHHIACRQRINLTFRRLKQEWADKAPNCRCGQKAVMKASLPSSSSSYEQQRYYYGCDNTQGPGCGYFKWTSVSVGLDT